MALLCASQSVPAQNVACFFNEQGNTIGEMPLNTTWENAYIMEFSPVKKEGEVLGFLPQGFHFVDENGNNIEDKVAGFEIILSGTRFFNLEMSREEGLHVSFQLLNEQTGFKAPRKAAGITVKGGELARLSVTVPQGYVPTMDVDYKYPGNGFSNHCETTLEMLGLKDTWPMLARWNDEDRQLWDSLYFFDTEDEKENQWHRDPADPCRWSYLFRMPDCDFAMRVNSLKISDLMAQMPLNAMRQVYRTYLQYSNRAYFMNGDSFLTTFLGDGVSGDAYSPIVNRYDVMRGLDALAMANTWICSIPWEYGLHLVDWANRVIWFRTKCGLAQDAVITAQMKLLRAFGYLRLLQYFAPRWQDSNNGAAICAPIYASYGSLDKPASTMKEIIDFCYADLRNAIDVLPATASDNALPNKDVARGLMVRFAMLREDWSTAREYAQQLVASYPLTTREEYLSGFNTALDSWIWSVSEADDIGMSRLNYWSAGHMNAVNGGYATYWQLGSWPGAIDRKLYTDCYNLENNDIRLRQYYMPEQVKSGGGIETADFFKNDIVDSEMFMKGGSQHQAAFAALLAELQPQECVDVDPYGGEYKVFFGAQMKFWRKGWWDFYPNDLCLMRVEEFLLDLAEADWYLGRYDEANALIRQLYASRTDGTASVAVGYGNDLLEAIRLNRRLELWGEGHAWFDAKRWGVGINRHAWVAGDNGSGNWPEYCAGIISKDALNGWRFVIPRRATEANPSLSVDDYGYTDYRILEESKAAVAPAKPVAESKQSSPPISTKLEKFKSM